MTHLSSERMPNAATNLPTPTLEPSVGGRSSHDDNLCMSLGFEIELLADESGKVQAPKTIPILPNKRHVKARDGREFIIEDPQALIDAVRAGGVDLVVGRQHDEVGTLFGVPGPAAGWIDHKTGLKRDGKYGIKAEVQWTDIGLEYLESRSGRYISPVISTPGMFEFLYLDGPVPVVEEIIAASVVSIPALRMPSLNSRMAASRKVEPMNEEIRQRLCAAFGLPLDAKSETILTAAEAKGEELEKLSAELDKAMKFEAIASEVVEAEVDLKDWVPREEFNALAERLKKVEAASANTQIDQAIAKHRKRIASPKYEAALRKQLASGALSFDAFEELMAATPESRLTGEDQAAAKEDVDISALGLEPHELEFCREHNKDPKKFAEIKSRRINKRKNRVI